MDQWLRGLAALTEDWGSVPNIHMVAYNACNSSSRDIISSSDLHRHQTCVQLSYITGRQNISEHKISLKSLNFPSLSCSCLTLSLFHFIHNSHIS